MRVRQWARACVRLRVCCCVVLLACCMIQQLESCAPGNAYKRVRSGYHTTFYTWQR
jgi:hypothetical protein